MSSDSKQSIAPIASPPAPRAGSMAAPASALTPAASAAEPPPEPSPRATPAAASRASTAAQAATNAASEDLLATYEGHLNGLKRLLTRPRKEVVMFLGAGFLMPLGPTFGSWWGLLQAMITRAESKQAMEERAEARMKKGRGPQAHADEDLIKEELKRAKAVLENAGGSGAKLQRVAQLIEDTVGDEHMTKLGIKLLELPPEVYDNTLKAEYLLSQTYAEYTRIERLSREELIEELKVRLAPPTPEAPKRPAMDGVTEATTLEELKAKRKEARDPSDIKANLVKHPSDDDKDKGKGIVQFRKRIAMVRLLPLKAIITTNFTIFDTRKVYSLRENEEDTMDHVNSLKSSASREALRRLLREEDAGDAEVLPSENKEVSQRMDKGEFEQVLLECLETGCAPPPWNALDPPVFHAHGTLNRPVFTKLSYRQLLHDGPTFLPFMRALLTTKTLLYFGFSFSDEYLEELRSQCLALLVGSRGSSGSESQLGAVAADAGDLPASLAGILPAPLGYAIMEFQRKADKSVVEPKEKLMEYHRRHEGLGFLLYETTKNKADEKVNHDKADELLKDIVQSTSLRWRLHERLAGSEVMAAMPRTDEGPAAAPNASTSASASASASADVARLEALAAQQAMELKQTRAKLEEARLALASASASASPSSSTNPQKRKGKHILWYDRPSPDSMSKHVQALSELSFMQLEEKEPLAFEKIKELKAQRKEYEGRFVAAKEAAKKVMEAAKSDERARVKALTMEALLAELHLRERPLTDYKLPEARHTEVLRRSLYEDSSATREKIENARLAAPPPTSKALTEAGFTDSEFGGAKFERLMAKTGGEMLTNFEVPYRAPEMWPLPDGGSIDCVFAREDFLKLLQDHAELPAFPPLIEGYVVESANDSFEAIDDVVVEIDKRFESQRRAYYSALFTLNGFLGPKRPSFLQTTMQVISNLPMHQKMPVIACGQQVQRTPYERWAAQQRSADYRALGCFSFCCTFSDVVSSLFAIIEEKIKEPPREGTAQAKAKAAAASAAAAAAGAKSAARASTATAATSTSRASSSAADPSSSRADSAGASSFNAANAAMMAAGGGSPQAGSSSPQSSAAVMPALSAMPPAAVLPAAALTAASPPA